MNQKIDINSFFWINNIQSLNDLKRAIERLEEKVDDTSMKMTHN